MSAPVCVSVILCITIVYVCMCMFVCVCVCVCVSVLVGSCLATEVFIGNLLAMGRSWVVIK